MKIYLNTTFIRRNTNAKAKSIFLITSLLIMKLFRLITYSRTIFEFINRYGIIILELLHVLHYSTQDFRLKF